MKRGLKLTFLNFHSYPHLMNILEIQKFYFQNIPHRYLIIFYRRSMFRLAEKLAQSLKINCLITGENLGQVSSQTIENMTTIEQATNLLIIRPLICFNKEEIMAIAQKIETKKISELKEEDCCSLFIPDHPITKANLDYVIKIENQLKDKIFELENKIFNNKEKFTF